MGIIEVSAVCFVIGIIGLIAYIWEIIKGRIRNDCLKMSFLCPDCFEKKRAQKEARNEN